MKVYFVRHGSTDSFEKKICQSANEPLNEKGKVQALEMSKRFHNTHLDIIISSSLLRAIQTTEAIGSNFITSDIFKEVTNPTETVGRSKEDKDIKDIRQKIRDMYLIDPTWHFSDEENFEDVKKRGLEALEFLKSQNAENILVVSHGNFIALMVGLMLCGEDYSVDLSSHFDKFLRLDNTGVSICNYRPLDSHWQLQCWNDTSHLLE